MRKLYSEFTANISHELKTPLTAISGLAEMIEIGMAKDEDIRRFAKKISKEAKRLADVIDKIIRLSEFDRESVYNEREVFDVYDTASSVISALDTKAKKKNIQVELTGEKISIVANRQMISELLHNLIDNGIMYNSYAGKVNVTLTAREDLCKITVSDTGIGISPECQAHIFEQFYRVDHSHSKKTGGIGLGLTFVKYIVDYHKGRLDLESTVGVGTTISCYITIGNIGNAFNNREL